ncbi:hypothetical protein VTN02DRAFT_1405 [Thermoascus thermophilus]
MPDRQFLKDMGRNGYKRLFRHSTVILIQKRMRRTVTIRSERQGMELEHSLGETPGGLHHEYTYEKEKEEEKLSKIYQKAGKQQHRRAMLGWLEGKRRLRTTERRLRGLCLSDKPDSMQRPRPSMAILIWQKAVHDRHMGCLRAIEMSWAECDWCCLGSASMFDGAGAAVDRRWSTALRRGTGAACSSLLDVGQHVRSYRCLVDQTDGFTENEKKKGTRDRAPEKDAVHVWRRMAAYGTIPFRTGPRTSQRRDVENAYHLPRISRRLQITCCRVKCLECRIIRHFPACLLLFGRCPDFCALWHPPFVELESTEQRAFSAPSPVRHYALLSAKRLDSGYIALLILSILPGFAGFRRRGP